MQLKYQDVFMDIQNKILSGYWPEDTMIPTEVELCHAHNVSRITIRRALDDLVQLGLIRRSRGKGTFVCKSKPYAEYRNGMIGQDGVEYDTKIFNRIIEDVVYDADTDLTKNMKTQFKESIKASEGIVRLRFLRIVDERPYAVMSLFMPESISRKIDRSNLVRNSFLDAYTLSTGNTISTLHRTVSAVIPDDDICTLLGAKKGTAHLWMKTTACLATEEPVAISYSVYNGNMFDFAVQIDLQNPPKGIL